MVKTLAGGIITEINAQQKAPRLLVTLIDANGYVTLRYVLSESNITFPDGGTTWTAKNMEFSNVEQSIEGQIERITVRLDDVVSDVSAFINSYNYDGGRLKIWRIYMDLVTGLAPASGTEYNEIFDGKLEMPGDISYEWTTFSATIGKPLKKNALQKTFNKECDHVYGDLQCNQDGNATLTRTKGRADSGSNTTLVHSDLWQKDDFWNDGQILIIKGTNQFVATITDFVDGTLTFDDIGTDVDNTCLYYLLLSSDQMKAGISDSGSTTTLVDDSLTQVDDFWNHGTIEITKAGITERRSVKDFDAVTDTITFDVATTFEVDNTCGYTVIKGCNKVWNTCHADNAWGPIVDNTENFIGWVYIGTGREGAPGAPNRPGSPIEDPPGGGKLYK